jgi:hypothetical protein
MESGGWMGDPITACQSLNPNPHTIHTFYRHRTVVPSRGRRTWNLKLCVEQPDFSCFRAVEKQKVEIGDAELDYFKSGRVTRLIAIGFGEPEFVLRHHFSHPSPATHCRHRVSRHHFPPINQLDSALYKKKWTSTLFRTSIRCICFFHRHRLLPWVCLARTKNGGLGRRRMQACPRHSSGATLVRQSCEGAGVVRLLR